MRPASAGAPGQQRSRLQIKVGNRGLCRRTEPRDADIQMKSFLDCGTVPVLSFKASPEQVEATLIRPLQAVRTELMGIATAILDRVVGKWGCVENLIQENRGEKIDRQQQEDFIEEYLRLHNIPGKLQIRWVNKLSSGGKLQEYGRRDQPTARRLRLWICSGFAGVQFSRSMVAFADHEICTHAVRAINDHAQVWVNHRGRYGLSSGSRERLSTEEGLAALNSLICYPSETRHMWSAAMLYYCAVKGKDMGFGELHKHLTKYVRCPVKRYWYCVRTKGKRANLDQPGSCGKGQVYLEGAVDILRAVDGIDFHLLYSGRVPLSKLDRVRHIVRPSLVTLPRFVQDQAKYKAILRQIGRLNGIHLEDLHPGAGLKQTKQRRAHKKSPLPKNRRTKKTGSLAGKEATAVPNRKQASADLPTRTVSRPKTDTPPSQKSIQGLPSPAPPEEPLFRPSVPGQPLGCAVDHATNSATQDVPHHLAVREGLGAEMITESRRGADAVDEAVHLAERSGGALQHDGAGRSQTREAHHPGAERVSDGGAIRPRTRCRPTISFRSGVRPRSAGDFAAFGRRLDARSLVIGTGGWPLAAGKDLEDALPPSVLPHLGIRG